jgi:hypothetical protein
MMLFDTNLCLLLGLMHPIETNRQHKKARLNLNRAFFTAVTPLISIPLQSI